MSEEAKEQKGGVTTWPQAADFVGGSSLHMEEQALHYVHPKSEAKESNALSHQAAYYPYR
jgi:hypothetical protein